MELNEPKPKKHCRLPRNLALPIILKKDGSLKRMTACFNGFSVIVDNLEDMKALVSMGYFGKANLSRSYPQFAKTSIIRQRQFNNRKNCFDKFPTKTNAPNKVIVVPDSDSDTEDYFTNLQPKYEIENSDLKEQVWLGLEEAFFLVSAVQCLNISYHERTVDVEELWGLFAGADPNFIRNYVVYFYYRAKNWVVKPGLKFGGDFLLYKEGPPFYHASYVVIIQVVDGTGKLNETLTNRCMENASVLGLNRLCETAAKELLICRIKWPEDNLVSYKDFTNVEVKEVLVRRWIPSQEREESL